MLVEQAAESFALWRGVRPLDPPVLDALRRRLAPQRIVTSSSALVGWIADRVVEVRLGGAHAHGHRESLHHFIGAGADDVHARPTLLLRPGVTSFICVRGFAW